jgi:undecaprenyl-phosphate 4-deoxy-4-formamido-L-arabinose transferase
METKKSRGKKATTSPNKPKKSAAAPKVSSSTSDANANDQMQFGNPFKKTQFVSVVIPVFNEQENIRTLCDRLFATMDAFGKKYEIIFVDDGSKDQTPQILRELFFQKSDVLRIITFNGNYGQYVAILAGFEHVRGDVVVTLDADLQNLPEEIPNLLEKIDEGYDLVGGYRARRQDNFFRTYASKMVNFIREKATGISMRDHGCMLRAYRRHIIDEVIKTRETSTFITALAQKFAGNPLDIPVSHEERSAGDSKYNLYKLIRITFDLLTGFSLLPLQLFTLLGMIISSASGIYFLVELFKKIVSHHHGYGLHFAFLFLLLSVIILGIGLLGEYIGRAYFAICEHPSFVIRDILEKERIN